MRFEKILTRAALAAALCLGGRAQAQSSKSVALPPPPVAVQAVAPAPAPAPAPAHVSDSEAVSGHLGVGFYGQQPFTLIGPTDAGTASVKLSVTNLGVRYWLPSAPPGGLFKEWGLDLGVGLLLSGGSATATQGATTVTVDAPGAGGFGLHAGLPLVLARGQHVAFELVPAIDFVHVGSTVKAANAGSDLDLTGNFFSLGASAGFEMFFGFLGIPQLALEANVGVGFNYARTSFSTTPNGVKVEGAESAWAFGTTKGNDPWDFVRGSLAARYYF